MKHYLNAFKLYADFSGRATRTEYWSFAGFNFLAFFLLSILPMIMYNKDVEPVPMMVYMLGSFIPSLAIAVRRMHDVGKSGWYLLIPIYNLILALSASVDVALNKDMLLKEGKRLLLFVYDRKVKLKIFFFVLVLSSLVMVLRVYVFPDMMLKEQCFTMFEGFFEAYSTAFYVHWGYEALLLFILLAAFLIFHPTTIRRSWAWVLAILLTSFLSSIFFVQSGSNSGSELIVFLLVHSLFAFIATAPYRRAYWFLFYLLLTGISTIFLIGISSTSVQGSHNLPLNELLVVLKSVTVNSIMVLYFFGSKKQLKKFRVIDEELERILRYK